MKKYLLISIISIFCFGSLIAQNAVFTIILNKGENTFGANSEFNPVLLGASLSENDMLKIIDSGYIASPTAQKCYIGRINIQFCKIKG